MSKRSTAQFGLPTKVLLCLNNVHKFLSEAHNLKCPYKLKTLEFTKCLNNRFKKRTYWSFSVLSSKVPIGVILLLPHLETGQPFTWSSEPHEGLAICKAKAVPSFLSYFKSLSLNPAEGI